MKRSGAAFANPSPFRRTFIPRRDYCNRAPPELPPRRFSRDQTEGKGFEKPLPTPPRVSLHGSQLSALQATGTPNYNDEQINAAALKPTNSLGNDYPKPWSMPLEEAATESPSEEFPMEYTNPRPMPFTELAAESPSEDFSMEYTNPKPMPSEEAATESPSEEFPMEYTNPKPMTWGEAATYSSSKFSTTQPMTRKLLWLMIENLSETQRLPASDVKNGDIVRWLDYDPKYLDPNPDPLPANELLECETWSGKAVVVPSEYAHLISSNLELANVLQRRPRAEVVESFAGISDGELSVKAGEVIYLLFECSSTEFMAMNKNCLRGRVPKSVLNVLFAP